MSSEFSPNEQKVPGLTGFYHQLLTRTHNDNHLSKTFICQALLNHQKK